MNIIKWLRIYMHPPTGKAEISFGKNNVRYDQVKEIFEGDLNGLNKDFPCYLHGFPMIDNMFCAEVLKENLAYEEETLYDDIGYFFLEDAFALHYTYKDNNLKECRLSVEVKNRRMFNKVCNYYLHNRSGRLSERLFLEDKAKVQKYLDYSAKMLCKGLKNYSGFEYKN